MRHLFILSFFLLSLSGYSQGVEKVTKSFSVPEGWKTRIVKDTSFFPSFGKRHIAIWEFKCNDDKTEPVWFYVFNYKKEDSAFFHQKATMYYALSNCMVASNDNILENFVSFIKGDYFFVERMCPCYTKDNNSCRTLVSQLMNWVQDKKQTAPVGGGL